VGCNLEHENRHHGREEHDNQHEHNHNNHSDSIQRLKALISHWIEHNIGHLEKIRDYAKFVEEEGAIEVAKYLNQAVGHMQKSIDSLKLALKHL
jgi:molecular chaperone GrpE (heat shock protein)